MTDTRTEAETRDVAKAAGDFEIYSYQDGLRISKTHKVSAVGSYPFPHGLRRTPLIVQVQFSPDPAFDDVYIVQWPWIDGLSRGPVSIRADQEFVYLEFTDGDVFGHWAYATGWTHHRSGFFRVIAG